MKVTISVIKADVGSLAGHHIVPKPLLDTAKENLKRGKEEGIIKDFFVTNCGDDLELVMSHRKGKNSSEVHSLAWEAFNKCKQKAQEMHLYAAGQDILKEAFSGNVRGMGPGVAELEFEERKSEPVVVLMADKTEPGAFNLPLFRIFSDPFCTAGLVIDPKMHEGFNFKITDVYTGDMLQLSSPEEMYDILALIGTTGKYVIKEVSKKDGTVAASVSTDKVNLIAGKYVGKDDPVAIVRAQHGLPAIGEILEGFSFPHLVAGWMRGSHIGPLMPVGLKDAKCTRFDGPPRIVALGFQVSNGLLIGPADLFDDPAFNNARDMANFVSDYLRKHGPFMPHRLSAHEMEYTTLPQVLKKLKDRFINEK